MSEFTAAELLADADREARQLLGRARPTDGPALAAGWPGILDAASQVLAAIPHQHGEPAHDNGTGLSVTVDRMIAEVRAVGHRPAGLVHPSVPRIIDTWVQAAALLHRPGDSATSRVWHRYSCGWPAPWRPSPRSPAESCRHTPSRPSSPTCRRLPQLHGCG